MISSVCKPFTKMRVCGKSRSRLAEGSLVGAAARGEEELVHHLLNHQPIGLNHRDPTGRTAASYLAGNGCEELLELLAQFPGVDFNLPDNEGNTPLHFAAQAGHVEAVNILVQCTNIEIDVRNNLGFTPLMKAAIQGRTKCSKILLAAGASPTLRDGGRGLRAEEWARFCGRYVCAEAIEKAARARLLERGAGSGRWGSDPALGPHVVNGVLCPPAAIQTAKATSGGKSSLTARLRRALQPGKAHQENTGYSLVTHITSAAFCASSPALPATVPPLVKTLIRPLTVPKLQVTTPTDPPSPGQKSRKKK